jgi:hypothetical protein
LTRRLTPARVPSGPGTFSPPPSARVPPGTSYVLPTALAVGSRPTISKSRRDGLLRFVWCSAGVQGKPAFGLSGNNQLSNKWHLQSENNESGPRAQGFNRTAATKVGNSCCADACPCNRVAGTKSVKSGTKADEGCPSLRALRRLGTFRRRHPEGSRFYERAEGSCAQLPSPHASKSSTAISSERFQRTLNPRQSVFIRGKS